MFLTLFPMGTLCWAMPFTLCQLATLPFPSFPTCAEPQSQAWELRALRSSWVCAWPSGSPGICQKFSKPPMDISFLRFSFEVFCPAFCLPQLESLPLEIAVLNNCHWFLGQTPWWEHFPYWKSSKTDEIKISSMNGTFPESTSQSNSDTSLRTRLLRGLQTYLPVPMAARLLAFITTEVLRLLISKATMKLRRGYGNRTKHQKAYCSYKGSPTFLNQISLRLLQTFG